MDRLPVDVCGGLLTQFLRGVWLGALFVSRRTREVFRRGADAQGEVQAGAPSAQACYSLTGTLHKPRQPFGGIDIFLFTARQPKFKRLTVRFH